MDRPITFVDSAAAVQTWHGICRLFLKSPHCSDSQKRTDAIGRAIVGVAYSEALRGTCRECVPPLDEFRRAAIIGIFNGTQIDEMSLETVAYVAFLILCTARDDKVLKGAYRDVGDEMLLATISLLIYPDIRDSPEPTDLRGLLSMVNRNQDELLRLRLVAKLKLIEFEQSEG